MAAPFLIPGSAIVSAAALASAQSEVPESAAVSVSALLSGVASLNSLAGGWSAGSATPFSPSLAFRLRGFFSFSIVFCLELKKGDQNILNYRTCTLSSVPGIQLQVSGSGSGSVWSGTGTLQMRSRNPPSEFLPENEINVV
jgi:hypothetical protein